MWDPRTALWSSRAGVRTWWIGFRMRWWGRRRRISWRNVRTMVRLVDGVRWGEAWDGMLRSLGTTSRMSHRWGTHRCWYSSWAFYERRYEGIPRWKTLKVWEVSMDDVYNIFPVVACRLGLVHSKSIGNSWSLDTDTKSPKGYIVIFIFLVKSSIFLSRSSSPIASKYLAQVLITLKSQQVSNAFNSTFSTIE